MDSLGYSIDLGCGAGMDTLELLKNGWEVLAIDNNPHSFNKIKAKLNEKQLAKLETKKESFEELELPKADLINASYSIPFCDPKFFDKFWSKITEAINRNGRFSGHFLGNNDEWATRKNMIFLSKQEVLELFKEFQLEVFEEREIDKQTVLGTLKHWHIFKIVAKKCK